MGHALREVLYDYGGSEAAVSYHAAGKMSIKGMIQLRALQDGQVLGYYIVEKIMLAGLGFSRRVSPHKAFRSAEQTHD
jgi:hypothetical protein